jgi:lantibiotic modifying enzyme
MIGFSAEQNGLAGCRLAYSKPRIHSQHLAKTAEGIRYMNQHRESFLAGVKAGYSAFTKNEQIILSMSGRVLAAPSYRSRALLRNSSLYRILQLRLWTPVPQDLSARKEEIFDVLGRGEVFLLRNISAAILHKIIEVEFFDMEAGDIPFFWTDASSEVLFHSREMFPLVNDGKTAMDRLRENFHQFKMQGENTVCAKLGLALGRHYSP